MPSMIMDRDYSMDAWQLPPALSGKILWLCFCYHPRGLQGVLVPACCSGLSQDKEPILD